MLVLCRIRVDLKLVHNLFTGGTGITPMYQLVTAVLRDASDNTELALFFANQVTVFSEILLLLCRIFKLLGNFSRW